MPVNEVVVKGFPPHFFVAVVISGQHNEVPPRGGAGVRRLIFTIVGTFFLFFDHRHCEVLHFDVKHC